MNDPIKMVNDNPDIENPLLPMFIRKTGEKNDYISFLLYFMSILFCLNKLNIHLDLLSLAKPHLKIYNICSILLMSL
jgi:hypothetical protein